MKFINGRKMDQNHNLVRNHPMYVFYKGIWFLDKYICKDQRKIIEYISSNDPNPYILIQQWKGSGSCSVIGA